MAKPLELQERRLVHLEEKGHRGHHKLLLSQEFSQAGSLASLGLKRPRREQLVFQQELLEHRHPTLEHPGLSLGLLEPRQCTLEPLEPTQAAKGPILELPEPELPEPTQVPKGPILELPELTQVPKGPILELLEPTQVPKGPILELLEPTQVPKGPILELLEPTQVPKGPILELLEPNQVPKDPILELLEPNQVPKGPILELLEPNQVPKGPILELLEPTRELPAPRHPTLGFLGFLGPSLGLLGSSLGLSLEFLGVRQCILEVHLEFLELAILVPPGPKQGLLGPRKDILVDRLVFLGCRHTIPVPKTPILRATRYAGTVDALREMAQLTDLYYALRDQLNRLEQNKCGQSDLQRLQDVLTNAVDRCLASVPPNLNEQLASLKSIEDSMKDEKEKIDKIQRIVEGDLAAVPITEMPAEGAGQINMQIGYLRGTVQEIEKELKELREKQDKGKATLEQSVTDTALDLQDQLDKLRSVMENMMASSSTLLSMSMPPTPEPGLAQVQQTTCAACSLDVSEKVSQLFKRYEQLQDSINKFMLRQAEGKVAKKPKERQEEEVLNNIQTTILQVQEDCEKLNTTTGTLIDDHHQKQREISMLFKSLEKLEKDKADKERIVMEIDVKADKSALAAKVSRTQFDATTEQLHKMMQELLNKMAGQEQDWQKMLDKLLIEMDSKLDRLELDPFRQQLEERWKDIRKQLKERAPQDEGDEAAGIRRRLLAHFHCISCDRPLEMVVPGPHITTLPAIPGLPAHQSLRPYMVYEMEQIRQISRNLKLGPGLRFDALEKAASLNKLRRIHSKMLMEIQKVQSHYGGTPKVNAQMIRDLLQAQCLGSSQYSKR
ncbi:UNVERIFIED_CONTAM: hypothetical protein K2H54_013479 [Gekko kuhli]